MIFDVKYAPTINMARTEGFNKEELLKKGVEFIKEKGIENLNARDLAKYIGCSTQPIFRNYENMQEYKLAAKQIVYFTSSIWEQVIIISLIIFGVKFIEKLNSIFLRRNTQIFRRGTVKNIQISLGNEILKINQENIDNNSSGTFIQRLGVDTDKMAEMFTVGMGYTAGVISNIGVFIAIFIINWQVFIYYIVIKLWF